MGCFNSERRFARNPSRSSERSLVNGVQGNEMTPLSFLRSSAGCICGVNTGFQPTNQAYESAPQSEGEVSRLLKRNRPPQFNFNRKNFRSGLDGTVMESCVPLVTGV